MGTSGQTTKCGLHNGRVNWGCVIFFSTRDMIILEAPRIFYHVFGTRRIFYRPIFGWPTSEKSQKIDFFRFFQKLSKSSVHIEFCLKNTLNTPRGQFLPIDHHISQYKPLEKNRFFWTKIMIFAIFCDFLNFDDAIDYSAGTGRKCEILPEMSPLDPQDTSTYLVCYYMMTRTNF